jgi:membrane associated rhomboid family serine protease
MSDISQFQSRLDRAEAKAALMKELGRASLIMGGFVGSIWIVALINNLMLNGALNSFGIAPRTIMGLLGIVFAPFLHADMAHLIGNTGGILMLGGLVIAREELDFWVVTILGALVSGIGTWAIGRPPVHIGASGVIFAYFGYLLMVGLFERKPGAIALSVIVFLVWGGLIFGVFPQDTGISWEGHLFGFLGGALAARILSRRRIAQRV